MKSKITVSNLFLFVMMVIYPFILNNKYFDITVTKYKALRLFVILFFVIALFICSNIKERVEEMYKDKSTICLLAFLVLGIFTMIVSDFTKESFTGEFGRYHGLSVYLFYLLMCFVLWDIRRLTKVELIIISVAVGIVLFLGILNNFYADPLKLLAEVKPEEQKLFISTFGNLDVFGEYNGMMLCLFGGLFVFGKERHTRIISIVTYTVCALTLVVSRTDNVFIALIILFALIPFAADCKEHIERTSILMGVIGISVFVMALIRNAIPKRPVEGITEIIMWRYKWATLFFLLVAVIIYLLSKVEITKLKKIYIILVAVAAALIIVGFPIICLVSEKLFSVEFRGSFIRWENYRGELWRATFSGFGNLPISKKLFGVGTDTLFYFYAGCPMENFDVLYDNAHCFLIQILVSNGILGLIAYCGCLGTCIYEGIIACRKNVENYPFFISGVSFFFMSLVGIQLVWAECFAVMFLIIAKRMTVPVENKKNRKAKKKAR